jgi:hypothetical protein
VADWIEDLIEPFEAEVLAELGIIEWWRRGRGRYMVAAPLRWPEAEARKLELENAPKQDVRHFWRGDQLWEEFLVILEVRLSTGRKFFSHVWVSPRPCRGCPQGRQMVKEAFNALLARSWEKSPGALQGVLDWGHRNGADNHANE